MHYKVLFKKRSIDQWYSLGNYKNKQLAKVIAKGEYYYRGGCTPDYEIIKTTEPVNNNTIPSHLFDTLIEVVGFLNSEEQEIFRDEHIKYLKKIGRL